MNIELLSVLFAFLIIAVASAKISTYIQTIHLPLITGFLLVGIISGPFILKMLPVDVELKNLDFINDLCLAFIAFAAGSELFLKDIRSRIKSISWITFGQLVITFGISSLVVYYIADMIPFIKPEIKLSVSREAFVIPNKTGSPSAGLPPCSCISSFTLINSVLST